MTENEQREAVHGWMRGMEMRLTTLENLFIELLLKLKAAGLIVDEDEGEEDEQEGQE